MKALFVAAVAALVTVSAQTPALRIVVLEGENAVNIIQRKTAVKALVEVRDQNNLPVPGATVTFAVTGKGGATVAGAQTVTVTTGASGQAALTGMTPSSSGGLQISVDATFKGLNAAATITQSVVATAAIAAAATAGTTVAATGAATGGGLGTGAIVGIVGGVAAVGAGVAVAGGGGQRDERDEPFVPSGNPNGQPVNCQTTVTPTTLTVPIAGGTFTVTVTKTPGGCAPQDWVVTNVPAFLTVDKMAGTGSGTVTLVVAPFTPTDTFPTRTGAISIASVVVNIHQPRPIS
jgi:hypothetical protein